MENTQKQPIRNAEIFIASSGYNPKLGYMLHNTIDTRFSDSMGRFDLDHVPEERDIIIIVKAKSYADGYLSLKPEQIDSSTFQTIVLSNMTLLKIQIVSSQDKKPVENFRIKAFFDEHFKNEHFHTAGQPRKNRFPNGTFELETQSKGNFWIQAISEEGLAGELDNIMVNPGEVKNGIVIELIPCGTITGYVYSDKDQKPITEATLNLEYEKYYICTDVSLFDQTVKTDHKGKFTFPKVAPGNYELTVCHKDFSLQMNKITIKSGEKISNMSFHLNAGGILKGKVVDKITNQALSNVEVVVSDGKGISEWNRKKEITDEKGQFVFQCLMFDKHYITAEKEGYERSETQTIEISPDNREVSIIIPLKKKTSE